MSCGNPHDDGLLRGAGPDVYEYIDGELGEPDCA